MAKRTEGDRQRWWWRRVRMNTTTTPRPHRLRDDEAAMVNGRQRAWNSFERRRNQWRKPRSEVILEDFGRSTSENRWRQRQHSDEAVKISGWRSDEYLCRNWKGSGWRRRRDMATTMANLMSGHGFGCCVDGEGRETLFVGRGFGFCVDKKEEKQ